jgi:predicted TIM-barrel fold metal-dependent hydrolase
MIIDFQQHYTPPEFLKGDPGTATVQVDERGNPNYFLNPLLADLRSHIKVMDHAGIDMGVLSCGVGFDQPDLAVCRAINDRMAQAEMDHPGRFIGLAHAPAFKPDEARAELKRCAVDLGFPGVVIASEMQGLALDAEGLRPFWKACSDLGLYVFIHPLARVINWDRMDADDLGRMFGWEFSLIVATIRLINSGLLDDLPDLKIHFSHFSGGIGRYRGRYNGFQQRDRWGTARIEGHNRQPRLPVDHYLNNRLYYDCAGWAGPEPCGPLGADWVKFGLQELALSQCVFATDYPQAIRDPGEVKDYVEAVEVLDPNAYALVHGLNAEKLIPDIKQRVAKRKK